MKKIDTMTVRFRPWRVVVGKIVFHVFLALCALGVRMDREAISKRWAAFVARNPRVD